MAAARRIVEAGNAARDAARIKVRQPLRSIAVPGDPLPEEIAAIIREELNEKSPQFRAKEVNLHTDITKELNSERLARDLAPMTNDLPRQPGLNVEHRDHGPYE